MSKLISENCFRVKKLTIYELSLKKLNHILLCDYASFYTLTEKEKISDKITVLFKKTVSKMFKFEWIVNSEFFLYIIDQLQLFSNSFIHMKHQ